MVIISASTQHANPKQTSRELQGGLPFNQPASTKSTKAKTSKMMESIKTTEHVSGKRKKQYVSSGTSQAGSEERKSPGAGVNPLDCLPFPVKCGYPKCGEVMQNAIEVDEHICEDHLTEAVWTFAVENMRPANDSDKAEAR